MSIEATVGLDLGTLALELDLQVADGEVVAVLGPNGAGKTTLLRCLAGLTALDRGRIVIDGRIYDDPSRSVLVPPEQRRGAMVFQDHLLFGHLDVLANVAFGLRSRGVARAEAERRAAGWLERMGLGDRAEVRPRQLSGGQAQRVALARALAPEPRFLLLDEPLSALDVTTRGSVRQQLRHHLRHFAGSCVLVTHDPLDAAVIADRLVVVEQGRVVQAGTLADITAQPRSTYVADLLGINLVSGEARGTELTLTDGTELTTATAATGPVFAVIPSQAISLHVGQPEGSPRNTWQTSVGELHLVGDRARVHLDGPPVLAAEVTPAALVELGVSEGSTIWVAVKATQIVVYPNF